MTHRSLFNALSTLPLLVAAGLACGSPPAPNAPQAAASGEAKAGDTTALATRARSEFGTLPAADESKPELAVLGRTLFFAVGASADGKVGCVNCHLPEHWGSD